MLECEKNLKPGLRAYAVRVRTETVSEDIVVLADSSCDAIKRAVAIIFDTDDTCRPLGAISAVAKPVTIKINGRVH